MPSSVRLPHEADDFCIGDDIARTAARFVFAISQKHHRLSSRSDCFAASISNWQLTKSLLSGFEILMALSTEDVTVNFAQFHHINHRKKLTHDGTTIVLAGVALLVVFLIVICLASLSPGTAASDLTSMTVLP
jgi:hypothetical protein